MSFVALILMWIGGFLMGLSCGRWLYREPDDPPKRESL